MALGETIQAVLDLQGQYSSALTEPMRLRGQLVRQVMPDYLERIAPQLAERLRTVPGNLLFEGSNGIGRMARVPWARFAIRERSPSASEGWYVVYLFSEVGGIAYLALAHASTVNDGGNFIDRSADETRRLVAWAREHLQSSDDPRLIAAINLGPGRLAQAYQSTTVAAYAYRDGEVPPDTRLLEDALSMASRLCRLYEAERLGQLPNAIDPELAAAEAALEEISSPLAKRQGFGLTTEERRAVEMLAMRRATSFLHAQGFSVRDVSATNPYDLVATRAGEEIHVEVKGSTGSCEEIILTVNEVRHHQSRFPHNGLIVLRNVQLSLGDGGVVASGGDLQVQMPWELNETSLAPISYRYRV